MKTTSDAHDDQNQNEPSKHFGRFNCKMNKKIM